jgi:hypothetical protein
MRVTLKKVGKVKKPKPPKPKRIRQPPPPPPPLTPLEKVERSRQIEFRRTVIPALLTMGLAMFVLGCWSIGVLAAGVDFFHPRAEITVRTSYLAKLALLAWPIAFVLLGGASLFMYEVHTWLTMYPPELRTRTGKASGF